MTQEALVQRLKEEVERAHREGRVELRPWLEDTLAAGVDRDSTPPPLHPDALYVFAEKLMYIGKRIERVTAAYQGAKRMMEETNG